MNLKTTPLMTGFGAQIHGVDLSQPISDSHFQEILNLYYEYSVVLFRNQNLTPADQARIAHQFGKPKIETRKQFNLVDHPEVSTIGNIKDANGKPLAFFVRGGFSWHTDGSAACHVDAATFLYAVEVPQRGGDTLFCSTADGYDLLSDELKAKVENVSMLCSFHAHNDPLQEKDPESFIPLTRKERDALPPVWHRVVQTHPVTGRKVLYLNFDAIELGGIDENEGRETLIEIRKRVTQPERVYRHEWRPGDLIIWDNHSALHSGSETDVYENDRRLMHRSFVYTWPTERPLTNLDEVNAIFSR